MERGVSGALLSIERGALAEGGAEKTSFSYGEPYAVKVASTVSRLRGAKLAEKQPFTPSFFGKEPCPLANSVCIQQASLPAGRGGLLDQHHRLRVRIPFLL